MAELRVSYAYSIKENVNDAVEEIVRKIEEKIGV